MNEDDFYAKDYEIKVRFFTDQLGRMWQRFNYFLVLETALFGGKIYTENSIKLNMGIILLGLFVSIFWYIMGSEDRYLVRVYRKSIEDAFKNMKDRISIKAHYYFAGDIDSYKGQMKKEDSKNNWFVRMFNGWRMKGISTTQLAVIIPFLIMLIWLAMLLWYFIKGDLPSN